MKVIAHLFCAASILVFSFHRALAALAATNQPVGFRLIVKLQDGSKIIGKNGDDNFQFRSDVLGEMKLPLERIRSIACQPKTNSVQLATTNGDTLTAQFVTRVVRVETAFGGVKLPVNLIRHLTVSPAGKPGQMRESLVALWPGECNANDVAGTNNGVLVNGVTFASGMVGQGFSFNGVNSYVQIADSPSLNPTDEFTIELWYKDTGSAGSCYGLVSKRPLAPGACNYDIQIMLGNPGSLNVNFEESTSGTFQISRYSPAPVAGVFHHVAATFQQSTAAQVEVKTFIDGQLVKTATLLGNLANTVNNLPVTIGCDSPSGGDFINGIIDEVSIYNRALTASEIQADYEAGKGSN